MMGMSWGVWLIAISTVLYIGTCIAFLFEGKMGLGIAYGAYALANIGLALAAAE
jgi:hypothetical protein